MTIPAPTSAAPPNPLQFPPPPSREVYLVYVPGRNCDDVRVLLEGAVKSRGPNPRMKINLIFAEGMSDCSAGEILLFPDMVKYKGLNQFNIEDFIEDVFVKNNKWIGSKESFSGIYFFVRRHGDDNKVILVESKEALDLNITVTYCSSWESAQDILVFSSKDKAEEKGSSESALKDLSAGTDFANENIICETNMNKPKCELPTNGEGPFVEPEGYEKCEADDNDTKEPKPKDQFKNPETLYLCYGNIYSWSYLGAEHEDELPVALERCMKTKGIQVALDLFDKEDSEDFGEGDVIVMPNRVIYRGLTSDLVEEFVRTILVNENQDKRFPSQSVNGMSFIFVCCEQMRTERICSVCGPIILNNFKQQVASLGLQNRVSCYACSHPMGVHIFQSEVVLYNSNNSGELWFNGLEPRDAEAVLSQHFLNEIPERVLGDAFSVFWEAFVAAVDSCGYARRLVDVLGHFIFGSAINSQVKRVNVQRSLNNIQIGITWAEICADHCDAQATNTTVEFPYLALMAAEANDLLRFIYRAVRKIKQLMMEKLSVSPVGPMVILVEVLDLADVAKELLYKADLVRDLVEALGGTPQREGSNLRAPVADIEIFP